MKISIPLKEMKVGLPYVVVKGSRGIFNVGDRISMASDDSINCIEAQGWLGKEDWSRLRTRVRLNTELLRKQAALLEHEARRLILIADNDGKEECSQR
jgi:hypothetical protein